MRVVCAVHAHMTRVRYAGYAYYSYTRAVRIILTHGLCVLFLYTECAYYSHTRAVRIIRTRRARCAVRLSPYFAYARRGRARRAVSSRFFLLLWARLCAFFAFFRFLHPSARLCRIRGRAAPSPPRVGALRLKHRRLRCAAVSVLRFSPSLCVAMKHARTRVRACVQGWMHASEDAACICTSMLPCTSGDPAPPGGDGGMYV